MSANRPVGLFGIGCTSLGVFADDYRSFFRKRNSRRRNKLDMPSMLYVPVFKPGLKQCDIFLVETVATFIRIRDQIPNTSSVIISDSPLLLSELPGIKPLDWMKDVWRFKVYQIDYAYFESERNKASSNNNTDIWVNTIPESIDRLGLIIDETSSGSLLTPVNSVVFQLAFSDRVLFRRTLAEYLAGVIDFSTFESTARNIVVQGQSNTQIGIKSLNKVLEVLKTTGPIYQQACKSILHNRSPKKQLKGQEMTTFEVKYLTRLIVSNIPSARPKKPVKPVQEGVPANDS